MGNIRRNNGKFAEDKEKQAKPWQAKDKERYAELLERYPNLKIRREMLSFTGQHNTKTMEQIKAGLFPRACMDSPKRWREADLRAWLEENAKA